MTPSYPLITNSRINPHSGALSHYCKSWDTIISILETGLKFSYCLEKFSSLEIAIPMVSFCDVPIFKNEEHTQRYGNYTIAISKDYLFNQYQNCAPVRYIRSDEPIFSVEACLSVIGKVNRSNKQIIKQAKISKLPEIDSKGAIIVELDKKPFLTLSHFNIDAFFENNNYSLRATEAFYKSLGYLKRISEDRILDGKTVPQSNYDECEWRIITIPTESLKKFRTPKWLNPREYAKWRGDKSSKKPLLDTTPVVFSVFDIAYILIPTDKELAKVLEDIRNLKKFCNKSITSEEKDILCSRIITREALKLYC